MQKIPKELVLSFILILVCVSRLIPHPYNFSPVGSIFLMAPIIFSDKRWSLIVSIIPLFISDVLINKLIYKSENLMYEGFLWIYISYIFIWLYSYKMENRHNLLTKSFIGSLIFFFTTNAFCWIGNPIYSKGMIGLIESCVAGIPFYWNSLAGFVFYSLLISFTVNFIEGKIYNSKVA